MVTSQLDKVEAGSGPDVEISSYLQYLPSIYRDNLFLARFLRIMENILEPVREVVGNVAYYFDPYLTPAGFLSWLGEWVGLAEDDTWPLERRREMVRRAAELYRWRGTPRGLREHLAIYAGVVPVIQDNVAPHTFAITVPVADPADVDEAVLRAIIEAHRPAQARYRLQMGRGGNGTASQDT